MHISDQPTVVIPGIYSGSSSLEVIGDSKIKLPEFPKPIYHYSMVITNNNELMIFGGVDSDECYKLVKGSWEKQNALTRKREYAVAIVMSNGIYVFGGQNTACRSDFLPNDKMSGKKAL